MSKIQNWKSLKIGAVRWTGYWRIIDNLPGESNAAKRENNYCKIAKYATRTATPLKLIKSNSNELVSSCCRSTCNSSSFVSCSMFSKQWIWFEPKYNFFKCFNLLRFSIFVMRFHWRYKCVKWIRPSKFVIWRMQLLCKYRTLNRLHGSTICKYNNNNERQITKKKKRKSFDLQCHLAFVH